MARLVVGFVARFVDFLMVAFGFDLTVLFFTERPPVAARPRFPELGLAFTGTNVPPAFGGYDNRLNYPSPFGSQVEPSVMLSAAADRTPRRAPLLRVPRRARGVLRGDLSQALPRFGAIPVVPWLYTARHRHDPWMSGLSALNSAGVKCTLAEPPVDPP